MAIELMQSDPFFRLGPIGRGLRLIMALLYLFFISPVTALRPGGVINVGDLNLWIGLAVTFLFADEVVNHGLRRDFGLWPRYALLVLLFLGSFGAYLINSVWWGEIVSVVAAAEILLIMGYTGISFVVAAALAVPGCEMRAVPQLVARLRGNPLTEHT